MSLLSKIQLFRINKMVKLRLYKTKIFIQQISYLNRWMRTTVGGSWFIFSSLIRDFVLDLIKGSIWSLILIGPLFFIDLQANAVEYNLPVRFELLSDRIEIKPIQLKYQFLNEGKGIRISDVNLEESDFYLKLNQGKSKKNQAFFSLKIPALLESSYRTDLSSPRVIALEFISRTGKILFNKKWESKKNPNIFDFDMPVAKLDQEVFYESILKEPFLVCISNIQLNYGMRLCSSYFELKRHPKKFFVLNSKPYSENPKRIIFNGQVLKEDKTESGSIELQSGQELNFLANLSNGWSLELKSKVNIFKMTEMLKIDSDQIYILGEGAFPYQNSIQNIKIINQEKIGQWTEFFSWQETIGDLRVFWEMKLKSNVNQVIAVSEGGVPLIQEFKIKNIPVVKMRPFLSERTPNGTYVDGMVIEGKKHPAVILQTDENKLDLDEKDNSIFYWSFKATERGKINKSYLDISTKSTEENPFKAYYEVYKGFPREFSLRLSGVAGSGGGVTPMGEMAFNYWFEDLWGLRNYWLSRHRWGVSLKGFQSIQDVSVVTPPAKITEQTADLKYRLTPGLWNRDETWGLMFSYQNAQFGNYKAGMAGGGFFWARSMPKLFDDIFNLVPVFRYPKWVDLEFIYYSIGIGVGGADGGSLKSPGSGGNGNWALNFHGKLMWTNNIFGEAGFGVKQLDFLQDRFSFQFTTFYGTVGLGYNF